MKINPINFADITLVYINNTPHCKKHGAMNKITKNEDGGGYWRCLSYVTKTNERACNAGCIEIRN